MAGHTFSWSKDLTERVRVDLAARSTGKTLLEIPHPGGTVEFLIASYPFIKSYPVSKAEIFQSFTGRDSSDNPIFGYFYQDLIHLSYYRNGQIISISPAHQETDIYRMISTDDPESMGEIHCAANQIPQLTTRNGGESISCQSQNYASLTFDLFVACTGEWGNFYHDNKNNARNAIAENVSAANAFFTAELNISFNLITDDEFLFTNSFLDPFTSNGSNLADQARNFFRTQVNSPFDIGHVMHYLGPKPGSVASGVAYVGSSCDPNYKGGGWTGTDSPGNASFNLQVFGHEIAHQLGASHSFYGTDGNCSGANRSKGNGFEPGSGSTMMAYESQCGSHNLDGPQSASLYFNTHSISEILQRINGQSSCGSKSGRGSGLSVQMPRDFSIPLSTAFDLTATGGSYSYIWEQYDTDNTSPGSTKGNPINGGKYPHTPMYRSYDPSPSGNQRSFPSKEVQQDGRTQRGEVYATVARDITMRLMTRSGGNVDCDEMTVTVRDAPAFQIRKPLQGDLVALSKSPTRAPDRMTVQWETGGTGTNGFPEIDILYSIDGGQSYPYLLADDVTNDGEHIVRPPETDTDKARLKILLSDGTGRMAIYHENRGNFTVSFSVTPIEIARFAGLVEEDHHTLSWVLNNSGEHVKSVNLEYSYDGVNFHPVPLPGFASLNTNAQWAGEYKSYFTKSVRTYYRLAIVNIQQNKILSAVISLNNDPARDRFLTIYPIPASHGEIHMNFQKFLQPGASVYIRSVTGQIVYIAKASPNTKTMTLPFAYPDGLYLVELVNGNQVYREKVIVRNR